MSYELTIEFFIHLIAAIINVHDQFVIIIVEYCSHRKSVAFYALSIAKQRVACPCTNWDLYRASSCMCDVNTGGYFFGELCDPSYVKNNHFQIFTMHSI